MPFTARAASLALLAATFLAPGVGQAADLGAPVPKAPAMAVAPWEISASVRYWYSWGSTNYAFTNLNPAFGDPTSTLDWTDSQAHSGEAVLRFQERSMGFFVKALGGGGAIGRKGTLVDRDFFAGQIEFSDTTSRIDGRNLGYAIVDVGAEFIQPTAGFKFGPFVGYQYWSEKTLALGARCNPDDVGNIFCPLNVDVIAPGTPAIQYDSAWHAVRIGVSGTAQITDRLSISGEAAWIPYASFDLDDSHFQRPDLGGVPNILSNGSGKGVAAELFVNYAVTQNFEVGVGGRYWGMFAERGTTKFGPAFAGNFPVTRYDQERYGILANAKYRF